MWLPSISQRGGPRSLPWVVEQKVLTGPLSWLCPWLDNQARRTHFLKFQTQELGQIVCVGRVGCPRPAPV